ncbi:MBL fold metallo-hydrolase [Lampropedia puyangensis]|nr:MBL fold metallo-hydrolase [Lampropedia puyangensis]
MTSNAIPARPLDHIRNPEHYRFSLGDFQCLALSDGVLSIPMDGVYADSDPDERERLLALHGMSLTTYTMDINFLLVDTGKELVLIDTGLGESGLFGNTGGRLRQNLAKVGISLDAIDWVLITHAHTDHYFGLIDAKGQPVFPHARIAINRADFDYWTDESQVDAEGHRGLCTRGARAALLPYQDRLEFLNYDQDIVPGIRPILTPGHTVGHTSFLIQSAGKILLNLGDVSHHAVIEPAHPEWSFSYDSDVALAKVTRADVFRDIAAKDYLILGCHFPFPGLGRIVQDGAAYTFIPRPALPLFE